MDEIRSVFDLLRAVRHRPSMYVGGDEGNRVQQLFDLELMLHGYTLGVHAHGQIEACPDFPREFADYLRRTRGWSATSGAVVAIRAACPEPDVAWSTYWALVDEFECAVASPSQEKVR